MRSVIGLTLFLCASAAVAQPAAPPPAAPRDVHSYARPEHVRVRHVELNLEVDFTQQKLRGQATLTVERTSKDDKQPLVLDSRKLTIDKVETSSDGKAFEATTFEVGKED